MNDQNTSLDFYLNSVNERITKLEKRISDQNKEIIQLSSIITNSSIISPNFLTRAFSIWGHTFIAQIIITIVIYAVILFAGILIGASINLF